MHARLCRVRFRMKRGPGDWARWAARTHSSSTLFSCVRCKSKGCLWIFEGGSFGSLTREVCRRDGRLNFFCLLDVFGIGFFNELNFGRSRAESLMDFKEEYCELKELFVYGVRFCRGIWWISFLPSIFNDPRLCCNFFLLLPYPFHCCYRNVGCFLLGSIFIRL